MPLEAGKCQQYTKKPNTSQDWRFVKNWLKYTNVKSWWEETKTVTAKTADAFKCAGFNIGLYITSFLLLLFLHKELHKWEKLLKFGPLPQPNPVKQ